MRINARGPRFVEIDYTPMIDMTFQLIAFFIFVINFSDAEQDQRVQLPKSALAKPPAAAAAAPITIQMVKGGQIVMSGQLFADAQAIKPLLNNEKYVLELRRQKPADATIIIRAHKEAKAGLVQSIIQVCQEMGFEKFTLRAKSDDSY